MLYNFFKISVFFILLLGWSVSADAQKLTKQEKKTLKTEQKQEKARIKKEKKAQKLYEKEQQKLSKLGPVTSDDVVYIFGVGTNFNDSLVYLTRITQIDSMRVDKKTGFLPNRVEFSLQLRQYLEGTLGHTNETTAIFFHSKRKKIEKYFYKLKKRYLDEGYKNMIVIDPKDFTFQKPAFVAFK